MAMVGPNDIYNLMNESMPLPELLHVWLQTGARAQTLQGHGHWVNTLALSAEYALRTGPFDHTGTAPSDPAEAKQVSFAQIAEGFDVMLRLFAVVNCTAMTYTNIKVMCPVIVATHSRTKKKICNEQQNEDKHLPNSAADTEKRDKQPR